MTQKPKFIKISEDNCFGYWDLIRSISAISIIRAIKMITSPPNTIRRKRPQKNHRFLSWFFWIVIFLLILFFLTKPLRISSATKYVEKGDELLMQKKYVSADLEYEKALSLNNKQIVIERRNLTEKCARNIMDMENLLKEKNNTELLTLVDEANVVPGTDSELVRKSKELIEKKEYQLAIIPAQTAIEMDKNYRDAWLYLGISNLKSAQYLELKPDDRNFYLNEAKTSLNKAKDLDPEYQSTQDYLKVANNL